MPSRSIKVVNMHEEQPETKQGEPLQQQKEEQPYEEEQVQEAQE